MFFYNKQTGQFGATFNDARATVNASVPANASAFGDWQGYADTNPPAHNQLAQRVVEVAPVTVKGVLTQQWRIDALSPAEVAERESAYRQQLHAQIQQWRAQQETGGFVHAGHRWDTDRDAITRMQSTLLTGTNPLGFWTSADNVDVPMDFAGLQALWVAFVQFGGAVHVRQRQMKDEVAQLTGDALLNYRVGWPA